MAIRNRFSEMHGEISEWRRDIHQNPELMFDVFRTSDFVANKLEEFGCDEIVRGIGRTGVVGIINGRVNTSGKTIGMRADMDALPIKEDTSVPYTSKTPGVMHACGHDGHTAMLLGAAKYFAETRNFNGRIAVIFQPAEEGGGGGKEMVDDGMMERFGISEVYGMHNVPAMEVGDFAIRSGPFFAAADTFHIKVEGKGGHAAQPDIAVDTTLIASHIVIALQTIASRNIDPVKTVVVSVTSFETDTKASNVIPQNVLLKGTVRTMDKDVKDAVYDKIHEISEGIAKSFGGTATVEYEHGYPVTENHEQETEFAVRAAQKISNGVDDNHPIVMGAEDFSYMLNARPGAFILIGNGDTAPLHHPQYDFNDEVIPAGCSWWVEMAEQRLPVA